MVFLYLMVALMAAGVVVLVCFAGFFTVEVAHAAVVTRFGRVARIAGEGLRWKLPWDKVADRVSLRASQVTLKLATRTRDKVAVTIPIMVETRIHPEKVFLAWTKMPDVGPNIISIVEQTILGNVRALTLDELFASQAGIAAAVLKVLASSLEPCGYQVVRVELTRAVPRELEASVRYRGRLVPTGQEAAGVELGASPTGVPRQVA